MSKYRIDVTPGARHDPNVYYRIREIATERMLCAPTNRGDAEYLVSLLNSATPSHPATAKDEMSETIERLTAELNQARAELREAQDIANGVISNREAKALRRMATAEAKHAKLAAQVAVMKEHIGWCISSINHYQNALEILSTVKDGKTLFEASPMHDSECYGAWLNLNAAGAKAELVKSNATKSLANLPAEAEKLLRVMKFGLAVLEESRTDLGDIDGGWIQDKAESLGLLERVTVTEPCGEECRCAEYGDFPHECLRYSQAYRDLRGDKL